MQNTPTPSASGGRTIRTVRVFGFAFPIRGFYGSGRCRLPSGTAAQLGLALRFFHHAHRRSALRCALYRSAARLAAPTKTTARHLESAVPCEVAEMRFTKMQGIGNDYVYVDCVRQRPPADPAALARAVSDRHFGVGGDGLILICPSERADARMRMFNADGSEAEMCGNGLRCVAKFVHDHGIATKPRLSIETGRGVLTVDLEVKNGKANRVRVNMGEPILEALKIPTTLPGNPPINAKLVAGGVNFEATCVSMGNPHAVVYVA